MNYIINGFHSISQKPIIDSIINNMNGGIGYLIVDDKTIPYKYPNITILYVNDINRGIYPNRRYVFSDDFLSYIHKNFYLLTLMMQRKDSFNKSIGINFEIKKKEIYTHFAYWFNVINNINIDFFISSNIPHDIYDFIIFLTLQYFKKTKILFFYQSNFIDMIVPFKDVNYLCPEIKDEFKKLLIQENFSFTDFLCKKEFNRQMNNETPFYMKNRRIFFISHIKKVLSRIFSKSLNKNILSLKRNLIYKKQTKDLLYNYNKIAELPKKEEMYFYFPLHYQPELTSCPLGGNYINQYLIIDLISSLLPDNYFLYIKEHPKQEIAHRYNEYYSDILHRNKNNIRFIKTNVNTFDLIENSKGVITITGTAGWEAVFKKKPVIVFGKNFYNYAPNVFYVESTNDCDKALKKIIENKLDFDEIKIKKYLQAVKNVCIEGFIDPFYKDNSSYTFEQSNNNIIRYINKFINGEK